LRGDLAAFFVGARADVDGSTFARKQVGGYTTGNLALAYEVLDGLEITARVHNLADRDYEEVDGYPAPGRRFLGGIRWSR
jgi:vitamin B12 transporter